MVCKQCGAYNEASKKYCTVCGALLVADMPGRSSEPKTNPEAEKPGWGFVRSPSWPKPSFDLNSVDEFPEDEPTVTPHQPSLDEPEQGASQQPSEAYPFGQAPVRGFRSVGQAQPEARQPGQPIYTVGGEDEQGGGYTRSPQRPTLYRMDDDDGGGYTPPPRNRAPQAPVGRGRSMSRKPSSYGRHTGRNNKNTVFYIAAGVLAVLLIVFATILVNRYYSGYGGFFRNVFGGSPVLKDAVLTDGKNNDGVDCWIITVYVREGNTITVKVGDTEKSVVVGPTNKHEIRIPKSMLLPSGPEEGATAQVVPNITVTTKNNDTVPLKIPAVTVAVPSLTLSITTPSASSITVGKADVPFAGKVDDGTVAVTVEGTPLTVGADGTFSGSYTLPKLGVYTLTLQASKNGYQIAKQAINVDYSQAEATLTFAKDSLRISGNSDTATVKGKTDPGAAISVSGPAGVTLGTPTVNAQTGDFSFTAQMSKVGHYELQVTASKSGISTPAAVVVERAPDLAAYTKSVFKLDYSRMTKESKHQASYLCKGTVVEVTQSDPYVIAKLKTTQGELIFEYHATKSVTADGKSHSIYGDYMGLDEATGLPKIYCWFYS